MIKVAILGFGTVGSGVYEVLTSNKDGIAERIGQAVEVKYILDIRDFPGHPAEKLFTKNFDDIINDKEVSVVAEVIGGAKVAYEFTKKALESGKHVVTSNKELVATHGAELLEIAEKNGVSYLFEASVGGGIPVIHPICHCLGGNEITEIFGILNGTTNYILTQMIKEGKTFENALHEAQKLGYAEADPTADVEGIDACRKIAILSDLAYGFEVNPDKIPTEGISKIDLCDVEYAEKINCVIKLIGYCKKIDNRVFARVSPMFVPDSSPLSGVDDVFNAILVRGNAVGDAMFYGKGAGKLPTASAVVSDILNTICPLARKFSWKKTDEDILADIGETESVWFVRTSASEKCIADAFGKVETVKISSDEVGFVTPKIPEKNLSAYAEKLGAPYKFIRVLE